MPDVAQAPLVTGIDFVSVCTNDLDAAKRFYGELLGLPLTVDRTPYNAEFQAGNVTLSILHSERMGLPYHVNPAHLSLRVADVHAARARLEAAGVEFQPETIDTGVCHMAFFTDPDGNGLMFHHRYAPPEPRADQNGADA